MGVGVRNTSQCANVDPPISMTDINQIIMLWSLKLEGYFVKINAFLCLLIFCEVVSD